MVSNITPAERMQFDDSGSHKLEIAYYKNLIESVQNASLQYSQSQCTQKDMCDQIEAAINNTKIDPQFSDTKLFKQMQASVTQDLGYVQSASGDDSIACAVCQLVADALYSAVGPNYPCGSSTNPQTLPLGVIGGHFTAKQLTNLQNYGEKLAELAAGVGGRANYFSELESILGQVDQIFCM